MNKSCVANSLTTFAKCLCDSTPKNVLGQISLLEF